MLYTTLIVPNFQPEVNIKADNLLYIHEKYVKPQSGNKMYRSLKYKPPKHYNTIIVTSLT
jgi:hypothetical protein